MIERSETSINKAGQLEGANRIIFPTYRETLLDYDGIGKREIIVSDPDTITVKKLVTDSLETAEIYRGNDINKVPTFKGEKESMVIFSWKYPQKEVK